MGPTGGLQAAIRMPVLKGYEMTAHLSKNMPLAVVNGNELYWNIQSLTRRLVESILR
jgi:hypothetical protein